MQGGYRIASSATPDLLGELRKRRTQARLVDATYVASVDALDAMLPWLATAAKQLREAAERKTVHVAASLDVDQSTIFRFEEGETQPRDLDAVIGAYADDLDIDPMRIWEMAMEMWKAHREGKPIPMPAAPTPSGSDQRVARTVRAEAQRTRARREGVRKAKTPRDARKTGT
jgi:hypothetical protein